MTRLQWVSRLGCPELGGREPLDSATRGSREGHRAGLHAQGWWETNSELVSGAGSAGERVLSWVHTPSPVHNAPPSSTVSPIIVDPIFSRQLPPTTLPQWAWAAWPPLGTPLETPEARAQHQAKRKYQRRSEWVHAQGLPNPDGAESPGCPPEAARNQAQPLPSAHRQTC